jgi:hypothetical protein
MHLENIEYLSRYLHIYIELRFSCEYVFTSPADVFNFCSLFINNLPWELEARDSLEIRGFKMSQGTDFSEFLLKRALTFQNF